MSSEEKKEIKVKEKESPLATRYPADIFQAFDEMWDEFRRGFLRPWRPWGFAGRPWELMERASIATPAADLVDLGNVYQVCAEVPGIPKDKLDITITKDSIEISGKAETERKEEEKGYVVRERGYSKVFRRMVFPEEVVPEKAEATFKDGLLEISAPKKTPTPKAKEHKVKIK